MTNATLADMHQVLAQRTEDDQILTGQAIKLCSTQLQAGLAPVHASPASASSLSLDDDPTHIPHGEDSVSLPIPASELTAAAARLRPDPATSKALTRLLDGGWSYQDDDDLVIRFEPRSRGRGKKRPSSYTTTRDSCTCPGAIIRGGCYHPIAWQIVSAALVPTTSIECTLSSAMFVPLCLLALSTSTEHVTLSADTERGILSFLVPNIASATLTVEMTTPVILRIEQQVHTADLKRIVDALADALPPEGEQITLELSRGSVVIVVGTEDAPVVVDGLDTLPMDSPTL